MEEKELYPMLDKLGEVEQWHRQKNNWHIG
jgi:hypothetical protein